jgi:hypothetical protein
MDSRYTVPEVCQVQRAAETYLQWAGRLGGVAIGPTMIQATPVESYCL